MIVSINYIVIATILLGGIFRGPRIIELIDKWKPEVQDLVLAQLNSSHNFLIVMNQLNHLQISIKRIILYDRVPFKGPYYLWWRYQGTILRESNPHSQVWLYLLL